MNEYYIPTGAGESEYVEKRSQFLGHVRRVETEDEARAFIAEMKKKHYDARHNCWCYIIRDGAERYSDDGEPQGTAGIPMLEVFRREEITNVVCVVTRYFGVRCSARADFCARTRKAQRKPSTPRACPPCAAGWRRSMNAPTLRRKSSSLRSPRRAALWTALTTPPG